MNIVQFIADYLVIPIVLVGFVAIIMVPKDQRHQAWGRAILAGLVALLFAKAISLFYQGDRPFEVLGVAPGASFLPNPGFPSDHALLVFTIVSVVWATTKHKLLTAVLLCAAVLVSVGRVLALVHTPTDVIGGFACAILAVIAVYGKQFFDHTRQTW